MWRQALVDKPLLDRMRRATYQAFLRQLMVPFVVLTVLVIGLAAVSTLGGDPWMSLVLVALLVMPVSVWISSARVTRVFPIGSYVAYAVTPDGAFHSSSIVGTSVLNPGTVLRLTATRECWIVGFASGGIVPIPRELLPDADAALLVRHLPGPPMVPPPATHPAI